MEKFNLFKKYYYDREGKTRLMDGTIILFYSGCQLFAVDVNGKKGPNKWGYDLFALQSMGDGQFPIKLAPGGCYFPEKGGMTSTQMVKKLFSK